MRIIRDTFMIVAVCGALSVPCYAEPTETKAYGEEESDKALLYVIRTIGARGSNSVVRDLFAGTTYLLSLRGNSYGFVHVEPGRYQIWDVRDLEEIEFVPGETFYLLCGDQGMALLDEEEGRSYIESVPYYMPPDPDIEVKRPQKEARAAKLLPKIETRLAKSTSRIGLPEVPAPVRPSSVDDLVRVSSRNRIEIELMENMSSVLNDLGDPVWFRVREDATANGKIWLPKGTPLQGTIVEIKPARKGGIAGDIEIEFSHVEAPDGTRIPLIGQFIDTGRHRLGAAYRSVAAGGLLGAAMAPRGREALELRGEAWHVWTRTDAWVSPAERRSAPERDVAGPVEAKARFVGGLEFNLEKHRQIPDIALEVETDATLEAVALTQVGDWVIPDPPRAKALTHEGQTWTVLFDGWSLLRQLVAGDHGVPVLFRADAADGRSVVAEVNIAWQSTSPE